MTDAFNNNVDEVMVLANAHVLFLATLLYVVSSIYFEFGTSKFLNKTKL